MTDLHALANAISNSSPAIKKFCLAVADIVQPPTPPPPPRALVVDFGSGLVGSVATAVIS